MNQLTTPSVIQLQAVAIDVSALHRSQAALQALEQALYNVGQAALQDIHDLREEGATAQELDAIREITRREFDAVLQRIPFVIPSIAF